MTVLSALPEGLRVPATEIYLDAFWAKFAPILRRDKADVVALFAPKARLDRAIAAVEGERLLGIAGYKDADGGFFDVDLADLRGAFGRIGGTWRALALSLFERKPTPGEFLMDGIAVTPEARGKGVGSALLSSVEAQARSLGYGRVRLDVVDTNPRARQLYERVGFEAVETERLKVFKPIFGFAASTRMVKHIGVTPSDQETPAQ
ncbi:MAG: GNAT family N-acetyltransferase [Pseudomonadota bacterium]